MYKCQLQVPKVYALALYRSVSDWYRARVSVEKYFSKQVMKGGTLRELPAQKISIPLKL